MRVLKFAAIDIGSNAIRLLFTNILETEIDGEPVTQFKKSALFRVPLRLGEDAFVRGAISEANAMKLEHTMKAFHHLMEVQEVLGCRACATSAMREAKNGAEVVEQVYKSTGILIDIIEGKEEAEIIYSNGLAASMNKDQNYLYMDVGGGSTELTLFSKNKVVLSKSFNIGTIRLLNGQVSKDDMKTFRSWVKENTKGYSKLNIIGSGGNINKIYKMLRQKDGMPVPYRRIREFHNQISKLSIDDLMMDHGMNPDRADVIVYASEMFVTVMKIAGIKYLYAPRIGVSDGVVKQLYLSWKERNS